MAMTVANLISGQGHISSGSTVATASGTTTTGRLYIACLSSDKQNPTIANANGVTWTLLATWSNNGDFHRIYYGICSAGATGTWTITAGTVANYLYIIDEGSGVTWPSVAAPCRNAVTHTQTSSNPITTTLGSFLDAGNGTYFFAVDDQNSGKTLTKKAGWSDAKTSLSATSIIATAATAWIASNDTTPNMTDSTTTDISSCCGLELNLIDAVNGTATPSGVSSTSHVGSAAPVGVTNVSVNGVTITSHVGSATPLGITIVSATGVGITSAVGAPTPLGVTNVPVNGVRMTSAVGSPTVQVFYIATPSGVSMTSGVGSPVGFGDANIAPTGVSVTSSVGTATISTGGTVSLLGVSITSAVGSPVVSVSVFATPSGLLTTSEVGTAVAAGNWFLSFTDIETQTSMSVSSVVTTTSLMISGFISV